MNTSSHQKAETWALLSLWVALVYLLFQLPAKQKRHSQFMILIIFLLYKNKYSRKGANVDNPCLYRLVFGTTEENARPS